MVSDEELLSTIRLLSSKSAAHLQAQSYEHARMVVRQVAAIVHYWEVNRVDLDPIQREVVLDSIVFSISTVAHTFDEAVAEVVIALRSGVAAVQDGVGLHVDQGTEQRATARDDRGQ